MAIKLPARMVEGHANQLNADYLNGLDVSAVGGAAGGDLTGTYPNPQIGAGVILNADVNASAALAFSKLANLTSAHILVGSAGNVPTDTAVTGDVTINNTGVTAIGAGKVTNAMRAVGTQDAGLVTSLPGSPTTGDLCTFTDSTTAPTYAWRLTYDGSQVAANKWLFIGGSPQFAEVVTSQGTTSVTYAALATAGPSVTVPLAGDYMVEQGSQITNSANSNHSWMSYDIGGTGAVDADGIDYYAGASVSIITTYGSFARARAKTSLSASTALVSKYKATAGTATFAFRWMRVTPVRVG